MHCLGCKAGLAESCSHLASVMFYIEAVTPIQGKLSCTQVKCTWILPTYVNKVPYGKVGERLFSSKKTQKCTGTENQDIASKYCGSKTLEEQRDQTFASNVIPSDGKMQEIYTKLNACKIKAVALNLIDTYSDQFIDESHTLPIIPDLFETGNLELEYPESIKMCVEVTLGVSAEDIKKYIDQYMSSSKWFWFLYTLHWQNWCISVLFSLSDKPCTQTSQYLIKTMCYPSLCNINTKAMK